MQQPNDSGDANRPDSYAERRVKALTQRMQEETDFGKRYNDINIGILESAKQFSSASRKTKAAVAGASFAVLLLGFSSLPWGKYLFLFPFAGAFGGSIAALIAPDTKEDKRKRQQAEFETRRDRDEARCDRFEMRIIRAAATPDLQELLIAEYKTLYISSSGKKLNDGLNQHPSGILTPNSEMPRQAALPQEDVESSKVE